MNSPPGRGRRTAGLSATTAPARGASGAVRPSGAGSARAATGGSLNSPKTRTGISSATNSPPGSPGAGRGVGRGAAFGDDQGLSRVSSYSDGVKGGPSSRSKAEAVQGAQPESQVGLFHIIQQLAAAENALWNILDGLKANTTHSSFFCREYWGCSCSQAQLSLEKLNCNERLKRQVQQACVLESLSLTVASHLCSGVMQGISVTIRSRLRNLLYYIHENCLVLLDMVCQRWMLENQNSWQESTQTGHCPENLNLDILVRVKRYRRLRRGEHVMALRQHNEMIVNVVRQLCRGAAPKRPPLSSRGPMSPGGDRSPGMRGGSSAVGTGGQQANALGAVNEVLTARGMPLDRLKPSTTRSKMLQYMCFRPLLNVDETDPNCPWPLEDPYVRYGAEQFAQDGPIIWFEPLPPMLPNLEWNPKLPPPPSPDTYTLVLDLDETLVHYFEHDGMGNYDIRPGMHEFLERMNQLGYELVIFTAATQDYADWVIDQIDPGRLITYRLYRQHALPWGPIFVKDMSRLGRDLDRTLIIDNVQENFMLQPNNGIFIVTWYDDPHDTALFALTPLLDELIATRSKVPEILDKYRDQIPTWAGFDQFSQLGGDYSEFDMAAEEGLELDGGLAGQPQQIGQPQQQEDMRQLSAYQTQPAYAEAPAPQAAQPYAGRYQQQASAPAPAPAFSGVGGPCQAPPPQRQQLQQPQQLVHQQAQQPAQQGGYPQPQYTQPAPAAELPRELHAAVPPQRQPLPQQQPLQARPQQAQQAQPQAARPQAAPMASRPAPQPQQQAQGARPPAALQQQFHPQPAFAAGISGPCQAAAPAHHGQPGYGHAQPQASPAQLQQQQLGYHQQPQMGAAAAPVRGFSGIAGPCQVPRR